MAGEVGGATPSERYLLRLARRSFLSLWSHPNLYRDTGRHSGRGDGQEIADLIVLFNKHVLIFSDKHCLFKETDDVQLAWSRWYRAAIEKSAKQLVAARNWLVRSPERVFLDAGCTKPFPYEFPKQEEIKFHLIAVTRGSYEACRSYFNNESLGSLCIDMSLRGIDHYAVPFHVGHVLPDPFVHVLNELSLDVLLKELDTVTDFIAYLDRRAVFLNRSKPLILASGEEQIASIYLSRLNSSGRHDFVLPNAGPEGEPDTVSISEGHWEAFVEDEQYRAKKVADRASYLWDKLIEHFVQQGEGVSARESEAALRLLASESRFSRRHLSEQLLGALRQKVPPGDRFIRCGTSVDDENRVYVFLILPKPVYVPTYGEYRQGRRSMLYSCCLVAKLRMPAAHTVIGIASEPAGSDGGSEDLLAMEVGPNAWTEDLDREARDVQQRLGILLEKNVVLTRVNSPEYPDVPADAKKKRMSPADRLRERERIRNLQNLRRGKPLQDE